MKHVMYPTTIWKKKTVSQIRWEPKAVGDVATTLRLVQGWLGWRLPHGSDQPGRKKHAVVIISSSVMMIQITMRNFTGGPGSRWLDVAGSHQPSVPRFPQTHCVALFTSWILLPRYIFTGSFYYNKNIVNRAEPGKKFGLDLVALNIQRGREHGIPSYNRSDQNLIRIITW